MKTKKEKIITLLYIIIAKHLPESRHFFLAKTMRVFFAKKILRKMGENNNIEKGATFNSLVSIGSNSGIGINCEMNGEVTIGNYVMMGPEVIVYTQNHAFNKTDIPIQKQRFEKSKPVVIEDDVWIGRRVIILPGVTIGKGSIIGAGTIVTKNIPEYSVAVGNPARIIRDRRNVNE